MSIKELHNLFKKCGGVSTDSRQVKNGDLFFSLKGPNFNGNEYAKNAIQSGAKYAIVDEHKYVFDEKFILVDNCLETLQKLSTYHRNSLNVKVVGITGSNGKTTTKELVNSVLTTQFNTSYTKGNLNNHIGVPISLLEISEKTEIAIIEMGANHIGEIAFLCEICDPDFGYITNFGKAHLEGFGDEEGVMTGKKELYDYVKSKKGLIFHNNDDPKQTECIGNYQKKYSFGKSNGDMIYSIKSLNPKIEINLRNNSLESSLFGIHNLENIMAASLIGKYFKIDLKNIIKGISSYIPSNNRSQIIKKNSNKIILDAYNANPDSMRASLSTVGAIKLQGKSFAILGQMGELGAESEQAHHEIGRQAVTEGFDHVCSVGEGARGCPWLSSRKGEGA